MEEHDFEKMWAWKVARDFRLPRQEIENLYTENDMHQSDLRVRQYFKYAASNGISGTP